MGLRDALYCLEGAGLRAKFSGSGVVVEQSIAPDTPVETGSVIELRMQNSKFKIQN
jgi:hypothetical protein